MRRKALRIVLVASLLASSVPTMAATGFNASKTSQALATQTRVAISSQAVSPPARFGGHLFLAPYRAFQRATRDLGDLVRPGIRQAWLAMALSSGMLTLATTFMVQSLVPRTMMAQSLPGISDSAEANRLAYSVLIAEFNATRAPDKLLETATNDSEVERDFLEWLLMKRETALATAAGDTLRNQAIEQILKARLALPSGPSALLKVIAETLQPTVVKAAWSSYESLVKASSAWDFTPETIDQLVVALQNSRTSETAARILSLAPEGLRQGKVEAALRLADVRGDRAAAQALRRFLGLAEGALPASADYYEIVSFPSSPETAHIRIRQLQNTAKRVRTDASAAGRFEAATLQKIAELWLDPDPKIAEEAAAIIALLDPALRDATRVYALRYADRSGEVTQPPVRALILDAVFRSPVDDGVKRIAFYVDSTPYLRRLGDIPREWMRFLVQAFEPATPETAEARPRPGLVTEPLSDMAGQPTTDFRVRLVIPERPGIPFDVTGINFRVAGLPEGASIAAVTDEEGNALTVNKDNGRVYIFAQDRQPLKSGVVAKVSVTGWPEGVPLRLSLTEIALTDPAGNRVLTEPADTLRNFVRVAAEGPAESPATAAKQAAAAQTAAALMTLKSEWRQRGDSSSENRIAAAFDSLFSRADASSIILWSLASKYALDPDVRQDFETLLKSYQESLKSATLVKNPAAAVAGLAADAACDLVADGVINTVDVQKLIRMLLGLEPCTANIIGPGICDVAAVQRLINAIVNGGTCITGIRAPYVVLSWTPSPSPGVDGYFLLRGTSPGGPYVRLNVTRVTGTRYADYTVVSAVYYYVAQAARGAELSAYSNEAGPVDVASFMQQLQSTLRSVPRVIGRAAKQLLPKKSKKRAKSAEFTPQLPMVLEDLRRFVPAFVPLEKWKLSDQGAYLAELWRKRTLNPYGVSYWDGKSVVLTPEAEKSFLNPVLARAS